MATLTLRTFGVLRTAQDDTVCDERFQGGLVVEIFEVSVVA
jgi:hypothetical protein